MAFINNKYRGNLCPAPVILSQTWNPDFHLSPLERTIVDRELRLNMHTIKYEEYERVVKRYGYIGRITENILEEIAQEINLSMIELNDKRSLAYYLF